ncbi:hypothetical protein [Microcoleus sp. FACHB-68]|uniref:hypothetical protein n=1 Tax=Microcoleus sp. FACHB-68 TaxID=2692826 RepID=UPI0016857324|nr:hypothetical protein [Microcoleus sp. FACHB-68]
MTPALSESMSADRNTFVEVFIFNVRGKRGTLTGKYLALNASPWGYAGQGYRFCAAKGFSSRSSLVWEADQLNRRAMSLMGWVVAGV